jgi:hypothetical protein
MSSYSTLQSTTASLFPNATPFSLDNFENKKKVVHEGLDRIQNDNGLDNALTSLMTEYAKDDTKNTKEGMLTGTSANINLLEGNLMNYSRYNIDKNPIRPFTEQLEEMDKKAGVVSYKEGLATDDQTRQLPFRDGFSSSGSTTTTTGTASVSKSQKLLDLESKLATLTTEYSTKYRLYTDDLITRSQFLQTNTPYLNKVIRDISYSGTDASGAYYYINSFGYSHRYKDLSSVLLYDTNTCPRLTRDTVNIPATDKMNPFQITTASFIDMSGGTTGGGFSRFDKLKSYDMSANTPCIAAKNVKLPGATSSEDKFAWVDIEGRKHIYEAGVWPDKRHSSCFSAIVGEPITLTANQYNSIPTVEKEPMKETSECFRMNISSSLNTDLDEIKKKIDDTVAEIKKENQNIINNVATTTIIEKEKSISEFLGSLDDALLEQIKASLGDYYYPAVYVFWGFVIFIAILLIFKFAFSFVSPGGGGDINGNGDGGNGVPLFGIVILSLIVIFAVYYYFSYTYNSKVSYTVS